MSTHQRGCGVCGGFSRPFVCNHCTLLLHSERRKQLDQLQRQREELLGRLDELCGAKRRSREQGAEREERARALSHATAACMSLEEQLAAAKLSVVATRERNARRRMQLEAQQASLAAGRGEVASHHPHLIRYQSLTHQHVSSMLQREQRLKLKQVLDILPLKVEGLGSNAHGSVFVSVCGLRTPDGGGMLERRAAPEAMSAALGYLLLLLDLLGSYLGGPLLHEGAFQGSTSVLWRQAGFYNRRPPSAAAVLPLCTDEAALPPSSIASLVPTTGAGRCAHRAEGFKG
ncbi:hypothetical protein FOA52_014535 [Chlamydomonas sp. UWO 241]|nr:hypothetical protein FOA52_014535 [Chlamydomonas sp. UWO 241]